MTETLPPNAEASSSRSPPQPWRPTRYLEPSRPPRDEEIKLEEFEIAMAAAARWGGGVDFAGRAPKLLKPRRTVDYMGGVGRQRTLQKLRLNGPRVPVMHPNPSDLSKLLMPSAYLDNPTINICDVFIHSSMNKERNPISVVKWSPEGRWCLTGNQMGQFTLWNGTTFNFESLKQAHDHPIRALSYTHSGLFFLSADQSGSLKYFSPKVNNLTTFQAHREACRSITFSPSDEKFATGGDDGSVKIWNFGEATEERVLSGHGWDVRCVDWHPTKGLVVSGSKDLLVKFWDPRSGKELSTLHSHRSAVHSCQWSPNGHIVATGGGDGIIRLFDIRTFKELEPLKGHEKDVTAIAWHPIHNSLLTTASMDGSISHWDLTSSTPGVPASSLLQAHDQVVWALDYHPLGHVLASGSKDYSTRFWCRARPEGGQERDRWHVGENGVVQGGAGGGWKRDDDDDMDEDTALPGLQGPQTTHGPPMPGFAPPPSQPSFNNYNSGFSLPGLGPAVPGMQSQGQQPVQGRVAAPLPSQEDMLSAIGYSGERRGRGGGGGGGGRRGGRKQWD